MGIFIVIYNLYLMFVFIMFGEKENGKIILMFLFINL